MKKLSTAEKYANSSYMTDYHENFCFVTLKNKVKEACISSGPWGPDGDVMYWFNDGSMLRERVIVREFQLFKP